MNDIVLCSDLTCFILSLTNTIHLFSVLFRYNVNLILNSVNAPSMLALWFCHEGLLNQMMSLRKTGQWNLNSFLQVPQLILSSWHFPELLGCLKRFLVELKEGILKNGMQIKTNGLMKPRNVLLISLGWRYRQHEIVIPLCCLFLLLHVNKSLALMYAYFTVGYLRTRLANAVGSIRNYSKHYLSFPSL